MRQRSKAITAALLLTAARGTVTGQPISLEPGFEVSHEVGGLPNPTQVTFGPDGRLFVATRTGRVLAFGYGSDGIVGSAQVVAEGIGRTLLGIAFDADGDLFASSNDGSDDTGFLARLLDLDADGFYESQQRFVTNLPNAGHHNDQLVIDGRVLYVGLGSRTDDGQQDDVEPVPAATILRVDLNIVDFESTANLPQVHARGFRNPYGLALDRLGRLWAGDNGQDEPLLPDSLHLVEPGRHHGFPANLAPPDAVSPLLLLGLGTSANGLDLCHSDTPWGAAYADNLFIVRFDFELDDPTGVGMDVVRVVFDGFETPNRPTVFSQSVFATGFFHPLDAEFDPFGNLLVLEYGSFGGPPDGAIYRIALATPCEGDVDGDGTVSLADLAVLLAHFGMQSGALPRDGDMDGDGDVDLADLALLLARFGSTC